MADERNELLSRYLDDDLPANERAELETRLASDDALAGELEATRALRDAVGGVAAGMVPPPELDRVMEPMLRSAPPPRRRAGPVYRWLGAAAAVVLGVTVAVEMSRRHPEPTVSTRVNAAIDDEAIFELAPLPTAVPDEHRPLGATDRLLEEELPQPPAPEPAALDVIGPLESGTEKDDSTKTADPDRTRREEKHAGNRPEISGRTDQRAAAPQPMAAGIQTDTSPGSLDASEERSSAKGMSLRSAARDRGVRAEAPATAIASVAGASGELWRGPAEGCPAGTWAVVVVVVEERVTDIIDRPTAGDERRAAACRPLALLGAEIAGAPDGELEATIVVE